jgi:hypothetical protein
VLLVDIGTFSLAWWLGLYLLARDPRKPLLRRAGLGLLIYALALGAATLSRAAPTPDLAAALARAHWAMVFLPALCWSGALLRLLPEDWPPRAALDRAWAFGAAPLGLLIAGLAAGDWLGAGGPTGPGARPGLAYLAAALLVTLPLAGALALVLRLRPARGVRGQIGLLAVAGMFFGLGVGLLAFPLPWLPHTAKLLMIEFDLALLGLAIALFDAFDEGEQLGRDLLRSAAASGGAAMLFVSLVGLAIALGAGAGFAMQALLLAVVAAAIALVIWADQLAGALDRLVFAGAPGVRRERADLRGAASALPRIRPDLALAEIDEPEFARLTRRALSHYGDLARLASSPLTRLPAVGERLAQRGAPDDALERAAELKALLAESVGRLKPRGAGEFGTSDEWRYYNALYFPYVAGLKPYSQRALVDDLAHPARQALEWFRASVPERTLHNWQNAAARLIAQELRRQIET